MAGLPDSADQERLLAVVESRDLSVRETERLVRELRERGKADRHRQVGAPPDPDIERMEHVLRDALATKVTLQPGARGGRITISYYDADDLARLVERLAGGER